MMFKL